MTAVDQAGLSGSASFSEVVSDAPLTAGALTPPAATEGQPFSGTVFHFTDADPSATASDYTATITWGDGAVSTVTSTATADGQIVANTTTGGFDVIGNHTYAEEASGLQFSVSVADHPVAPAYHFNGFETAGSQDDWYGPDGTLGSNVSVVGTATGLLPTAPASGSNFAVLTNLDDGYQGGYGDAGFTVLGGSDATYHGTFQQSIDIYINTAWAKPASGDEAFWLDMAPYTFQGANYGGEHNFRFQVDGSGSIGVTVDSGAAPIATITTSGWYTFQMVYYKAPSPTDPALTDANILDSNGRLVGSDVALPATSPGGPLDSADLRGHDYIWLTLWQNGFAGDQLAIDNLSTSPVTAADATTSVGDAALTAVSLTPPTATEGAPVGPVTVFHFTDADPAGVPGDYLATVQTGDATLTSAADPANVQIVPDTVNGGFNVQLSYTYAEEFSGHTFSVTVSDLGGAAPVSMSNASFGVADATLAVTALGFGAVPGHAFSNVPVATFTDPGGAELTGGQPTAGSCSATINWGDGTATSAGTITYANGVSTVAGGHTYASSGTYSPQVTVTHEALPAVTVTGTAIVSSTVWVDDNWSDAAHPGNPQSGDTVTAPAGETSPGAAALIYGVNAFSSIQSGVNADPSGGTVYVLPGTYTELVTLSNPVTLEAAAVQIPQGASTVTAPASGSYAAIISVNAANVTVDGLNIVVDQPYASAGVAAVSGASGSNVFDGLQVLNNTITSMGTTPWGHGLANPFGSAYSVGIAALANGGSNIANVNIQGNQVLAGSGGAFPGGVSAFMRGIWVNQAQGTVGGALGNNVTGYVQDALVAFARGATTVQNNTFNWAGVTITEPNAGAPVAVTSNAFASVAAPDDALLLIKHDYNATSPVSIRGNTFAVPSSSIGVLSTDSIGVSVTGNNVFAPAAGATNTVDVAVDTFIPSSSQPAPYHLQLDQHYRQRL